MLAYSNEESVEAPSSRIAALIARHNLACAAAGVTLCQVTGSSIEAQGHDNIHATLALRASPAWLANFQTDLAFDAKAAGGRLIRATVTSEDLSRQIVDTEAAIRAKTALRDRVQAMLASRPGKLSELLDVETALADVQDKLDATQSELVVMRERVATSVMTVAYQSSGAFAPVGVWAPLRSAFDDFLGLLVGGVAVMVRLVAVLLPWAAVIGGGLWLLRKRLFGPGKRKTPPAP